MHSTYVSHEDCKKFWNPWFGQICTIGVEHDLIHSSPYLIHSIHHLIHSSQRTQPLDHTKTFYHIVMKMKLCVLVRDAEWWWDPDRVSSGARAASSPCGTRWTWRGWKLRAPCWSPATPDGPIASSPCCDWNSGWNWIAQAVLWFYFIRRGSVIMSKPFRGILIRVHKKYPYLWKIKVDGIDHLPIRESFPWRKMLWARFYVLFESTEKRLLNVIWLRSRYFEVMGL